jgi:hypothetical protein
MSTVDSSHAAMFKPKKYDGLISLQTCSWIVGDLIHQNESVEAKWQAMHSMENI